MRSLRKSFSLYAVLSLMALLPALAADNPSSRNAAPDLSFLTVAQPAVPQAACGVSSPLPSNKCDDINGLLCKPAGSTRSCITVDGFTSTCTCRATCRWSCLL